MKVVNPQLTEEHIKAIIANMKDGGSGIKEIMDHFKTNYPGQYDSKFVTHLVKQ